MIIGVPREIKQDEHRVSLVPAGAYSLVKAGHQVLIERGAVWAAAFPTQNTRM
jgi:alanine dehydrogenase